MRSPPFAILSDSFNSLVSPQLLSPGLTHTLNQISLQLANTSLSTQLANNTHFPPYAALTDSLHLDFVSLHFDTTRHCNIISYFARIALHGPEPLP